MRTPLMIAAVTAALAASNVYAQKAPAPKSAVPAAAPAATRNNWVAPGTKGSPIDGTIFHAQVLLDTAGFPTGVIDGKKGMIFKKAVQGFQQARNLPTSGELDGPTRAALLQLNRPSTVMVKLTADDAAGPFTYPFPKKPEEQSKLPGLNYRNMLEKVAERYHTTPDTVVALNGPTKQIGEGQTLRLPNVVPAGRDYARTSDKTQAALLNFFNIEGQQPKGNFVVVDKSDGVLRVYSGEVPAGPYSSEKNRTTPLLNETPGQLVAQFPVTMGSGHDPLPLGKWKATTYAFMPPFHYQPNLFWDAKDKTADDKRLPPGPNGPVGVAWLDLTKEHYGIHGTPSPETIGRAESHGCIRMSNWDVIRLSRMMKPGFTAIFQG